MVKYSLGRPFACSASAMRCDYGGFFSPRRLMIAGLVDMTGFGSGGM
jgi:hypothetical protein